MGMWGVYQVAEVCEEETLVPLDRSPSRKASTAGCACNGFVDHTGFVRSAGAKTLLEGFGATRAQRDVQKQLQIHFCLSSPGLHKPVQKVPVSATLLTSTRLATLGCAWETSLMIQSSAMCP